MAETFRLALTRVLVDGLGEHPGFVKSGSTAALTAFLLRDLFLDHLGVSIHNFLGTGSRSVVFGGCLGDHAVVVKLVSILRPSCRATTQGLTDTRGPVHAGILGVGVG